MEVLIIDHTIIQANGFKGMVDIPGDKSISHRAVMLGALAEGSTKIEHFLPGEDCLATIHCLQAMGIQFAIENNGSTIIVHGKGLKGLSSPENVLNAQNSGTTMRLLLGILAGQPFFSVMTGDDSLVKRPMARVTGFLQKMGASIWGREKGEYAPLAIQGGNLKGITANLPVASAQVKSAILLAGLFAQGKTIVYEPAPSRDHTERMLQYFGVQITKEENGIVLQEKGKLKACEITVPGDISSAAYFMVAASIIPNAQVTLKGVGINPTRDGMIEVLQQMGANIQINNKTILNGEPVADITVRYSPLKGIEVKGDIIPRLIDEIPILAVAASTAQGEMVIQNAEELKIKESNRIQSMVEELSGFGVKIKELPDGMWIQGGKLTGSICDSRGDHRIAMACAIAGLVAQGKTLIKNTNCVNISFPNFFQTLHTLIQ